MARRRMSKADKLARYRHRVDQARRWRSDEGYDDTWRRMIDLYRGKHFDTGNSDEDRIAINVAFSTLNVIYPSISVNHPKITVTANKPEDEDVATIAEAVVNYWWRHYDFREPFREAVKDFLTVGHGWLKVGWQYEEEEKPLSDAEYQAELDARNSELDAYAEANPERALELPTPAEVEASIVTTKLVVAKDAPYVERLSPFDVIVDPEATNTRNMGWIAQRIVRTLEEVKADERYKQSARTNVKADLGLSTEAHDERARKRLGDEIDRVTVWEFYDLKSHSMCAFAEAGEGYLIEPQPIPFSFGHPFVMVRNYEVPDEFYPIGDLEMIEGPQQELNKTRSQMMNHRKKYARKYLFRESAFGENGRSLLQSAEDNVAIPVVNETVPLQDVILPLPITPLSGDVYNYSEIIESDIDKVSGVNEYARGSTPEIRRTATEAAIIQDAANARAADKLAVIENCIGQVARRVLQLAQQYLTGDQVGRIVGPDGEAFWFPFEAEDIEGEFDFSVEAGSTQPNNETFRRQQAVALMQSVGPLIGPVIDPAAIAVHVLREGFGIKNPEKFLAPPMPPGMPPEQGGPPPGMAPDVGGEPGMNGEQPSPLEDPASGVDAVDPAVLAQLAGQIGYSPVTM